MIKQIKILNVLIVFYFFFRLEIINNLIPSIWFVFLLLIIFIGIRICSKMSIHEIFFLVKKNIWIFISLIILLFYKFFDYGNFRLDIMILYLLTSIPFLIIGFSYSLKRKKLNYIVFSLLILYFLSYGYTIIMYFLVGDFSREYLELIIFNGQENSGLIHLWPFLSTLILLSYGLFKGAKSSDYFKVMLYVIWALFLLFIFLSGFMSGVIFLLTSVISILFFKTKIKSILKGIVLLPILLYYFILFLSVYSVGPIKSKSEGLLSLIDSGFLLDESILNIITSNRSTAIIYSFNQFVKEPLFGNGIFLEKITGMMGSFDTYTSASGGHNFFIDLAAFMGVFSIPFILIYSDFIKNSRRISIINVNNKYYSKNIVIYSIFFSIFISNILNSWLLFSAFDNFIFLLAGYVSGQLYLSVNTKYISNNNF